MTVEPTLDAACHCGAVHLRVTLQGGIASARRCDCTFCTMRGAVAVTARVGDLHVTRGEDMLTLYQFNTGTARHWFCSVCGIYTHHRRRSNPDEYGVNLACIAGHSPFDLRRIEVNDGRAHPSDTGSSRVAGVLHYDPAP